MHHFFEFLIKNPNQLSAFIALAALCVSGLSIILTVVSLALQRRHNFLSVCPIVSISRADYEQRICVKIRNHGVGPLFIDKVLVCKGQEEKESVIAWMPSLPHRLLWTNFTEELQGRSLAPSHEIVLLELTGNLEDNAFAEARDLCRQHLSKLTIQVFYRDIYERAMKPQLQSLAWFGRLISSTTRS